MQESYQPKPDLNDDLTDERRRMLDNMRAGYSPLNAEWAMVELVDEEIPDQPMGRTPLDDLVREEQGD